MSDLYTYVMQHDTGLAPNPFWGTCTLAVCAPNHKGSRAKRGDWIAGVSDKSRGYKLIFIMEVDERVHMNDYFHDERFTAKKPILDGTTQQQCGDNFYSLDVNGLWIQHPNLYHTDPDCLAQDTRKPCVFVARRFWYLGCKAVVMPEKFLSMFGGRWVRVRHRSPELVACFKAWVQTSLKQGVNALPRDFEDDGCSPPSAPATTNFRRVSRAC
jgi:hypothetical protein